MRESKKRKQAKKQLALTLLKQKVKTKRAKRLANKKKQLANTETEE